MLAARHFLAGILARRFPDTPFPSLDAIDDADALEEIGCMTIASTAAEIADAIRHAQ